MLLVSVAVGLVLSAAVWSVSHTGSRSPVAAEPTPNPPGRFKLASVTASKSVPPGASLVARVLSNEIRVYSGPTVHSHSQVLKALETTGRPLPLIMLVDRRRRGWLKVQLPVRPNLSAGWIRAERVSVQVDEYRLQVVLSTHQLTVWRGRHLVERKPIGVGASVSPTPSGRYYITDLLRPPNPDGLYGPYAFGLSAYSYVYTSFAGGDGQIGLHGTDDPAGLGHDVSHGCIRVDNQTITKLAKLLPIGTPVLNRHSGR